MRKLLSLHRIPEERVCDCLCQKLGSRDGRENDGVGDLFFERAALEIESACFRALRAVLGEAGALVMQALV